MPTDSSHPKCKNHTPAMSRHPEWSGRPPTKRQFCGPIRGAPSSHLFSSSAGEKNMGAVTFASQLASPAVNAGFVERRDYSRMLSGPWLKSARWRNGTGRRRRRKSERRRAWPAPVAEVTNPELRLAKDDRAMNHTVGTIIHLQDPPPSLTQREASTHNRVRFPMIHQPYPPPW